MVPDPPETAPVYRLNEDGSVDQVACGNCAALEARAEAAEAERDSAIAWANEMHECITEAVDDHAPGLGQSLPDFIRHRLNTFATHYEYEAFRQMLVRARELEGLEARLTTAREALESAEKGIGSLLFVVNNSHNWAHPDWDGYRDAGEEDARGALAEIRGALRELEDGDG